MTALVTSNFVGEQPRVFRQNLPDNASQEAINCIFSGGVIRALRGHLSIANCRAWAKTIYRHNATDINWISYTDQANIVRGPTVDDTRMFITCDTHEPRITDTSIALSGPGPYPTSAFVLGVFEPDAAPSVSHAGGTGTAVARAFVSTFVTPWGEESAPSPASTIVTGKTDGAWTVSGLAAFPANSGTISARVLDTPITGQTTVTLNTVRGLRASEEINLAGTVFRIVSIDTALGKIVVNGVAAGSGAWNRVAAHNTTGMTRNVYWSSAGKYWLVAKNLTATSVVVTVATDGTISVSAGTAVQADSELQTLGWHMPPADLKGLCLHPSGALVGHSGKYVYFSEPYYLHAWPLAYENGLDYTPKGLSVYASSVVVPTEGKPVVLTGAQPATMSISAVDRLWPCLSARSVVSVGDGVVYATRDGLAYIGDGGAQIYTQALFSSREWETYLPDTMFGAWYADRIHMAYQTATGYGVMMIDPLTKSISRFDANATALWTDPLTANLYFARDGAVHQWEGDAGMRHTLSITSKEWALPYLQNFGAAKLRFAGSMSAADMADHVEARDALIASNQERVTSLDTGGVCGEPECGEVELAGDTLTAVPELIVESVTYALLVDGVEVYSREVTNERPFRLPSGLRTDKVAYRLVGTMDIHHQQLAGTMLELKNI